jgi:hypothetical protein
MQEPPSESALHFILFIDLAMSQSHPATPRPWKEFRIFIQDTCMQDFTTWLFDSKLMLFLCACLFPIMIQTRDEHHEVRHPLAILVWCVAHLSFPRCDHLHIIKYFLGRLSQFSLTCSPSKLLDEVLTVSFGNTKETLLWTNYKGHLISSIPLTITSLIFSLLAMSTSHNRGPQSRWPQPIQRCSYVPSASVSFKYPLTIILDIPAKADDEMLAAALHKYHREGLTNHSYISERLIVMQ